MSQQKGGTPPTERGRTEQVAYFSGRREAQGAPASGKAPFFARPVPPAVGVGVGLATAVAVVVALTLWPSGSRGPGRSSVPRGFPGETRQSGPSPVYLPGQMFVMTPTVKRLKDIPDGAPFRADMSTVVAIRRAVYGNGPFGGPVSPADRDRIVIETAPPAEKAPFQLVRKSGKFYLCAYTFGRVSAREVADWARPPAPSAAAGRTVWPGPMQLVLFNWRKDGPQVGMPHVLDSPGVAGQTRGASRDDGELTQILVPLDGMGGRLSSSVVGTRAELLVAVTRLDANAYTAWKPLPPPMGGGLIGSGGAFREMISPAGPIPPGAIPVRSAVSAPPERIAPASPRPGEPEP